MMAIPPFHRGLKPPLFIATFLASALLAGGKPAQNPFIAKNEITWTSLGKNENDSMPIGNGDLAANGWTEANGDLVVLLAKSDAWTEQGALVKARRCGSS
ncbi:MAG: DUF5703 domain-containing protein [Chthoniobacteraceae bacterium]